MTSLRDDRGAVAVLTAVLAVVLFGMAALVVDLGMARDSRRQAQNTADAAALAAANALYATRAPNLNQPGDFTAAVEAAKTYAAENYGTTEAEWASCSIPDSEALGYLHPGTGTNCITFDKFNYPTQALVVVPLRQQGVFFGGVFGYEGVSIGALAQAQLDPGGHRLCTFCVLGEETSDIQNGNVDVTGGNIWFNGDVTVNPAGGAKSTKGNVVGDDGSIFEDGGSISVSGTVNDKNKLVGDDVQVGGPRVVDPMAAQELPFATQSTLTAKSGQPCTSAGTAGGPGIYGSVDLRGGTCELAPGLYVFTGTLDLAGNSTLIGDGVTLYFTCGTATDLGCDEPGQDGGRIDSTGTPLYQLTAPLRSTHPTLPSELYGYSLVFDRYNTSTTRLRGTSDSFISGTIYGVNTTLDIGGTAGSTSPFTSWVIIGQLDMNGTATLTVNFDSSKNVRPSEGLRGLVR